MIHLEGGGNSTTGSGPQESLALVVVKKVRFESGRGKRRQQSESADYTVPNGTERERG